MEEVKKTAACGGKELSYLNYSALAKQRREFRINGAMTGTLKKTKQQKLRNKKKKRGGDCFDEKGSAWLFYSIYTAAYKEEEEDVCHNRHVKLIPQKHSLEDGMEQNALGQFDGKMEKVGVGGK